MSLSDALKAWLAHRREVLVRRSRFRLGKIESRLEILKGYLVAYLNIDEVIAIIRTSDKPMETLMERFGLTQNQANAILDMRLRSLRKTGAGLPSSRRKTRLSASRKSWRGWSGARMRNGSASPRR